MFRNVLVLNFCLFRLLFKRYFDHNYLTYHELFLFFLMKKGFNIFMSFCESSYFEIIYHSKSYLFIFYKSFIESLLYLSFFHFLFSSLLKLIYIFLYRFSPWHIMMLVKSSGRRFYSKERLIGITD